jgi:enterochelin esterase family protein
VTESGPDIKDTLVTFRLPDPDHALEGVWLAQQLARPRTGPAFDYYENSGTWELDFPRYATQRMEYMLELVHKGGDRELICDPTNSKRTGGPFGDKSVIDFPGYISPAWVGAEVENRGEVGQHLLKSRILRTQAPVIVWRPPGTSDDEPLPLLIAHDGPEYAEYSGLLQLLDVFTSKGELPPMRAALVPPLGDRNESYSASAAYSRTLAHEIVPQLSRFAPTPPGRRNRIGMGASLGALAMLHAHRTSPASFGALYLQSGSFFRQRFDKQESGFPRFRRISRFVGRVYAATDWSHPIRVTMTCGEVEENLHNNEAMHDALQSQGYEISFRRHPDAHNWISWRDTFDPHLTELLREMWT